MRKLSHMLTSESPAQYLKVPNSGATGHCGTRTIARTLRNCDARLWTLTPASDILKPMDPYNSAPTRRDPWGTAPVKNDRSKTK